MTANVTFNPQLTTNGLGSFNVSSAGYIQGTALDQPAIRNSLAGGVLDTTDTVPMWGGIAITEKIPYESGSHPSEPLGSLISRATTVTANAAGVINGFSVFDQDHAMINTPQSPVPLAATGMQVNFYRMGSGARIAVKCDPALANFEGAGVTQAVSWDFSSQMLVPSEPVIAVNVLTSLTWSAGTATGSTTTNHGIAVGQEFTISGVVPTGYNGSAIATSGTATNVLKWAIAANPGTVTTLGQVDAAGGALAVSVLDVKIGNCMVVSYDPATGFATWDRNGNCAIILI